MSLLPEIRDRRHYAEIFHQDGIWTPAVQKLAQQLGLQGPLHRGVRSRHIVYRVGEAWIKLMAPMFAQECAFEVAALKSVQGRLSVATPKILDQGENEGWVYLILSHLPGERVVDVWNLMSIEEKIQRARQMAKVTRQIHDCMPQPDLRRRGEWNSFIRDRRRNLITHHQFKDLGKSWLEALPRFMSQFSEDEFFTADPVLVHADLSWDHFLVDPADADRMSGLIAFTDARMGHPEYDLPLALVFALKGQREALRAYLIEWGIAPADLNERFSEKILAWTCLHLYSDLKAYFGRELESIPGGDFASLARLVFPL